jgi:hypothetical protein
MRIVALAVAALIASPAWAQVARHVPAIGSSPAEAEQTLKPLCETWVLAEQKWLTCTFGGGEAVTGSYTATGKLFHTMWQIPGDTHPVAADVAALLGFSGEPAPCTTVFDQPDECWTREDGSMMFQSFNDTHDLFAFHVWNDAIRAEDGAN